MKRDQISPGDDQYRFHTTWYGVVLHPGKSQPGDVDAKFKNFAKPW